MKHIDREGVRIYLHSAAHSLEVSRQLWALYAKRAKKESPEAHALSWGAATLGNEGCDSVTKLRDRGGLLHFGAVRCDRCSSTGGYTVHRA